MINLVPLLEDHDFQLQYPTCRIYHVRAKPAPAVLITLRDCFRVYKQEHGRSSDVNSRMVPLSHLSLSCIPVYRSFGCFGSQPSLLFTACHSRVRAYLAGGDETQATRLGFTPCCLLQVTCAPKRMAPIPGQRLQALQVSAAAALQRLPSTASP